jgi:multicomponent Na+:H+ antiporter subunit D
MFLYAQTGSLNFADVAQSLASADANKLTVAAFVLIAVGLMIKAGVFPLASWLPNAYAYAPEFVSGFVAGTATKVALFALIKIIFTLFGAGLLFSKLGLDSVLLVVALAAMFYGSIAAIYQTNVKKLLAYSSIANVGYIILGVALFNQAGLIAAIFNIVAHGLAKTGAFLAIGALVMKAGGADFKDLAGLGKKMPFTALLFVIFGFSLVGVPLTAGFVAKWYLLNAAIPADHVYLIIAAILLNSFLAVIYIWRVVEALYFNDLSDKLKKRKDLADDNSYILQPLWVLAAAVLYFGIHPEPLLRLAQKVAGGLL